MKRMFGILALMVIASIMIAGCVQPSGNETATPGTTPGLTETPMETETPIGTETPAETETIAGTETPIETGTTTGTETPAETGATGTETPMTTTTTVGTETPMTTADANATETPPGPPGAVAADETISITDNGYVPNTITVPADTTVEWTNDASTNQTVSATGEAAFFDSGMIEPGGSYNYTFSTPGNYTYQSMTSGFSGEVIVTF
ncbi:MULTISPECIES: cupredoxin domain-containing protein [unclassified Methanoculleus]|jgi:plastocyanin|uniref:Cupredoxin domain-containing protein n=1 Tax=Methanoculleus palmolei TaxID=72612 RepID=A0ABD8A6T4_9EURY|nr:cupredoxin domain-containing protein [Methanoculleus sp. UBA377]WOX55229.1 cupredoxin domain-containing protein [Methanoculleus palmolei]